MSNGWSIYTIYHIFVIQLKYKINLKYVYINKSVSPIMFKILEVRTFFTKQNWTYLLHSLTMYIIHCDKFEVLYLKCLIF